MGAPSWMFGWMFNSNMLDRHPDGVLGSIPAPKSAWHWQINMNPWLDEWKSLTDIYRKAALDDNLIEQNATLYPWEGPAMGKFAAGQYPFSPGYAFQGTISGYAPVTPVDMPAKFNKTFDELVGFLPYPHGGNGGFNRNILASMSGQSIIPHYVKGDLLDAAVDLYVYRYYGKGYTQKYALKYNETKVAADAYKFIAPANKFQKNPDLPADVTVEKAYGTQWVKSYMAAINFQPPVPTMESYFAIDKQTGPTPDAHNDLISKLSQTKDDVAGIVNNFQNTYNQQASTLQSDLSPDEFTAGAKKYLADLDKYFKSYAPEFYAGDWSTYYKKYALPALS
jgi:hypothetical protein